MCLTYTLNPLTSAVNTFKPQILFSRLVEKAISYNILSSGTRIQGHQGDVTKEVGVK